MDGIKESELGRDVHKKIGKKCTNVLKQLQTLAYRIILPRCEFPLLIGAKAPESCFLMGKNIPLCGWLLSLTGKTCLSQEAALDSEAYFECGCTPALSFQDWGTHQGGERVGQGHLAARLSQKILMNIWSPLVRGKPTTWSCHG